jgi:hypothetical protein
MLKLNVLTGFLFICILSCSHQEMTGPACEKIDGDANVRDSIKGEILFTLENNASVQCGNLKNRWYTLGTTVQLNPQQWAERKILAGTELIDLEGKEIGKSVKDIEPNRIDSSNSMYTGLILGYTHMNNIQAESFVEHVISEYLKRLNTYSISAFDKLFLRYTFKEVICLDGYRTFLIQENEIADSSGGYRIAMFFKNDNLVAIVHSRNLEASKAIDIDIAKGYKCLLFLSLDEKDKFIDKLNNFLNKSTL